MHVNTREIATEYRLEHWARITQERQRRGLSVRAFCEEEGFHENIYYYWQRKLREAACTNIAAKQTVNASYDNVPQGWAICGVTKTAEENKAIPIEIGCCRVLARMDADPQLLAKVCRVLVSL